MVKLVVMKLVVMKLGMTPMVIIQLSMIMPFADYFCECVDSSKVRKKFSVSISELDLSTNPAC